MTTAIGISIRTNAPAVVDGLEELVQKQIPFATAVTLTRLAQDGRADVAKRLPEHFKGPGKQGRPISTRVVKGIQFEPARKQDWPNPRSKVGTLDEFMATHVTGAIKRPTKGAKSIAVPTGLVKRNTKGAVPPGLKPRRLRDKPSVYVTEPKGGSREIVQRFGKRKGPIANLKGKGIFFTLVTQARIKRTWPIDTEVERVVAANYAEHFQREMTAAVRSARVRAGRFTSDEGRAAYLAKRTELGRI